jgi:aromatic-L-amino-acid decarboxylase
MVDWMADYLEKVSEYPVRSQVKPNEILDQLPLSPPTQGEPYEQIFADFQQIILPGITHWQSPNYFAYFPANGSYPSLLAEMLTATMGAQCMIWETSPAAAELEERCMNWLRDMCGLPAHWSGVIQDTASTASLAALLTAREQASAFSVNQKGFSGEEKYRVYCSSETHSSIEKGVKIAGLGAANLVKIPVDDQLALRADALQKAIENDIAAGYQPLAVMATLGTTSTTAMDPLAEIGPICQQHKLWLHVDAAFAGTAFLMPEYRHWLEGIEYADSYVFNPHKWMFTHFDCTAYFVKDPDLLVNTFSILPEYLKTGTLGQVNDYRDWGIPLGRRFRALKLWFVIRSYGVEGLQKRLREHIAYAEELEGWIKDHPDFELVAPRSLNLVCFRWVGAPPVGTHNYVSLQGKSSADLSLQDKFNASLIDALNNSGKLYLTRTKVNGNYAIRLVTGNTHVNRDHVVAAWELICEYAKGLEQGYNID